MMSLSFLYVAYTVPSAVYFFPAAGNVVKLFPSFSAHSLNAWFVGAVRLPFAVSKSLVVTV